jgi:hypothetical protein
VTLREAAWEKRVPAANTPDDTSYRAGQAPGLTARAWFGEPHLAAGERRTGPSLRLAADPNGWVFKLTGTDERGRTVAAWADLP